MNLFQLLFKQLRQRSLSSVLTVLSITLGVGLAIAILVLQRESKTLFAQSDYGYELLAGVKGSGLQLTINTVYRLDRSPGNIPYAVYENLIRNPAFRRDVKMAVPQCVGDYYQNQPIVGTTPQFFGYDESGERVPEDRRFQYRRGLSFELGQGKPFKSDRFEAILGSEAAAKTGLKPGDTFQAAHGAPEAGRAPDIHEEKWTVVGVLKPTRTAADKCVYIGLTSFYTIAEHGDAELARDMIRRGINPATQPKKDDHDGHDHAHDDHDHGHGKHYTLNADGAIVLDKDVLAVREVSAVLIKTRSGFSAMNLSYALNLQPDVMAVIPADVMRQFFENFVDGPTVLLLVIAVLVIVVASVGVLTAIYNSVAARTHEIAVLRALGATRARILVLVTAEAVMLGVTGAALGFVLGHALAGGGSAVLAGRFGEGIAWASVSWPEFALLSGVVVLAFFAGLVPALKAYQTPVATNLSGS